MRKSKVNLRIFPLINHTWYVVLSIVLTFPVWLLPVDIVRTEGDLGFIIFFLLLPISFIILFIVFRFLHLLLFHILVHKFVQISTSASAIVIRKYPVALKKSTDQGYYSENIYFIHLQHTDASKSLIWKMRVKRRFYRKIREGASLKLRYAEFFPNLMLLETEVIAPLHPINMFRDLFREIAEFKKEYLRPLGKSTPRPQPPTHSREELREFLEELRKIGFERSPRSDRLFYHPAYPERRLVITKQKIRLERLKERWQLDESYSIKRELDFALGNIKTLFSMSPV